MKKLISILLAAMMVLTLLPAAAFAEEQENTSGQTVTESSGTETETGMDSGEETGGNETESPKPKPRLTAQGGTFEYDGNARSVTAKVENGEGYLIMYSTDSGKNWTTAVPSITKPGTLTVCVKAVKSGETDLTCDDVTIEITGSSKTAKLTATGGTYPYDGKAHGVTAKVENGEGYSIEYSKDGKVWYSESPTQTKVGKLTVKVRALKSGAETLTAEATVEVTSSGGSKIVTIVNCKNSVNVRKGASSSTTKIGTAPKGAQYTLLEITGYWYKIQYKKNQTGYVFIDYVKVSDGSPSDDPTPSGDKIVTIVNCSNSVNVRKGGSTSYAKIGTAPKGAKYQYLGKSGDYYKIQYTKSTVGYVHKNYAKVSSGSVTPDPEPSTGKVVKIVNCKINCNVRKSSSESSEKLGVAPRDKLYVYLGTYGNYYKIQYTKSKVGFVHVSYGKVQKGTVTPDDSSSLPNQGTIVNCKTMVNVRSKPNTSSTILGTVKLGWTVEVEKTENNWTKIRYNGGYGYIMSKYISVG